MAGVKLDQQWLDELQSDFLRVSEKILATEDYESAFINVQALRNYLSPLIGDFLFDRKLWVKEETRSAEVNGLMAQTRFEIDTYLVDIQNILEAMQKDLMQKINILLPGTKEYKEDKGATFEQVKEQKVDSKVYAWNRAKPPFMRGFSKISSILVESFFPYLKGKLSLFEAFYGKGYDEELSVDDVVVVFTGDTSCNVGRVKKYMRAVKETSELIKKKGLYKLWVGRIYIPCGKREEGKFGVEYLSPPKDLIYIYEDPNPNLVNSLLYAFGNKFYYVHLSQEKRIEFQNLEIMRPKNSWGLQEARRVPDFAKMFAGYIQGTLPKEIEKIFSPLLQEDFFRKMIELQSNKGIDSKEPSTEASVKLASLYMRLRGLK